MIKNKRINQYPSKRHSVRVKLTVFPKSFRKYSKFSVYKTFGLDQTHKLLVPELRQKVRLVLIKSL